MVKKRKFRNVVTAGNSPDRENNYGVSETVPDQSLTVREIITRFASGTLPDIMKNVEYTEDLPDLRGLDISEIHDLKKENAQYINELKTPKTPEKPAKTEPDTTDTNLIDPI